MVKWFSEKQKFYAMTTQSKENIEKVEFENGKPRFYLKDSTSRKTHSFSFRFEKRFEEVVFWNWYDNILLSRTQTVELIDLVSGVGNKEYRMTEEPSVQDSQYPKEVQITVEEV